MKKYLVTVERRVVYERIFEAPDADKAKELAEASIKDGIGEDWVVWLDRVRPRMNVYREWE